MAKRVYRSMQGKIVDMELLAQKHELAPAIGNVRMNARGDELGPGGKIIRKREEIMAEYYDKNPNAVREEQFKRTSNVRAVTQEVPTTSPNVSPELEHRATTRRSTPTIKKEVKNDVEDNQTDS